jgi:gliding motility-associated-like protein
MDKFSTPSIIMRIQKYFFITVFLSGSLLYLPAKAQIAIVDTLTVNELVSDVLLGSGVQVSNITFNGNAAAIGFFDGTNSNLGLDSGLVLTSGDIKDIPGPNNSGSTTTGWYSAGDTVLDKLTTSATEDAAVLEFDFVPASSIVKFKYVFGSEEYMEWVNSSFNDVFGFFISGPGITGSANIALVPGTSTAVTINNVNLYSNASYYFDNENPQGQTVQFDGFTTVLEATVNVIACETYHIKLAVADAGDASYDSGVFLEAGSFESGISAAYIISESADDSSMYEGCSTSDLIFTRSGNIDSSVVVKLNFDGTAEKGVDYTMIPDSFTFVALEDTVVISIETYIDSLIESTETITINIINELCDDSISFTVTINIVNVEDIKVVAMADTNICEGDSVLLSADVSGGLPDKHLLQWEGYSVDDSIIYVKAGTYVVNVTDSCGRTDSDTIEVVSLVFVSSFLLDYYSDTIVNFTSSSADSILYWDFGDSTTSTENNPSHTYADTGIYEITLVVVNDMGCIDTIIEYVNIVIEDEYYFFIPNTFTPDEDGLNETFIGKGENVKTFEMYIYDRWGNLLYSTSDINKPWDGKTTNNLNSNQGVYQYLMKVINTKEESYTYRGLVTLVR